MTGGEVSSIACEESVLSSIETLCSVVEQSEAAEVFGVPQIGLHPKWGPLLTEALRCFLTQVRLCVHFN